MQEKLITSIDQHFDVTIRPFNNGIKFNVQTLDTEYITKLNMLRIIYNVDIEIKRSGTGLVVIITEK